MVAPMMNHYEYIDRNENRNDIYPGREIIVAELVPELPVYTRPAPRRVCLPVLLFIATCLSTLLAGYVYAEHTFGWRHAITQGLMYAVPVMTILICHEAGHFFQARRYGVHASLPYFIPMPITPIGTFGAVIAMQAHMGNRKALFDIGISGPLAGLVPTIIFCIVGLHLSHVVPAAINPGDFALGAPYLFKQLIWWILGPQAAGQMIELHPMAFAGWVGLLVTALNLLPIGQLDGGHILYGLLRTNAHKVATLLLFGAVMAVFLYGLMQWALMLFLLMLMGPIHPPTADDNIPLGTARHVLGWLTLAFILIGFTPTPFVIGP